MEENKNDIVEVESQQESTSLNETYKQLSPARLILRRFFRSKLSIVGLIMIACLFLFSFLGPVVYQRWGESEQDNRETVVLVTEEIEFTDPDGNVITTIKEVELINSYNNYAKPSWEHLLGTDKEGFDVFVRLMYGGRISLTIGFVVIILETIIGIVLGGIAGYFGKWVDSIIMRIVDIFSCIPTLPILLIASALLDSWSETNYLASNGEMTFYIPDSMRIYCLMVVITVFGWAGTARLVRGQILSLREQEYITATEVMGLPTWRKIFKHLIPNVMPQLIVTMTLGLGSVILYESTLSYLGLGVQFPKASWGTVISLSKDPNILKNFMNIWIPAGVLIVIAVLGFNFVGDGLRDAMDPRSKK